MISQSEIKSYLNYNSETGLFTYVVKTSYQKKPYAGSVRVDGYISIRVLGKDYAAHRLAWLYMTGEMPKDQIDHINLIKTDNRFCNLREANCSENVRNQPVRLNNKSGFKGVMLHKASGLWVAECKLNKVRHQLGYFKTPELASSAYKAFAKANHGEFFYEESQHV